MTTRIHPIARLSALLTASALMLVGMPLGAHAESITWSSAVPSLVWDGQNGFKAWLNNPMVTIKYGVTVSEVSASGAVLRTVPCGSTVAKGTRLKYSFNPHTSDDIYWFGTGSAQDSPYGDWTSGEPSKANRCADKNLYASRVQARNLVDLHASLAVSPPAQSVSVPGADCSTNGATKTCVMSTAGESHATFTFNATTGQFWGGFWEYKFPNYVKPSCFAGAGGTSIGPLYQEVTSSIGSSCIGKRCTCSGKNCVSRSRTTTQKVPYTLQVPSRSFSCTITVANTDGSNPPSTPTISGGPNINAANGASCTAGLPYMLSFSATSPDNRKLRYGIDWNADGSVDQIVPPGGYVPSGVAQQATRTFATAGAKTVKIYAQDEMGLTSAWSTIVFSCAAQQTGQAQAQVNTGVNDGSGIGYDNGGGITSPDLSINVVPSIVRRGATAKVTWSAARVDSCTVSGSNGDSWTGIVSPVGGQVTGAIAQRTGFTLSCLDSAGNSLSRTAYVNILPTWLEQ